MIFKIGLIAYKLCFLFNLSCILMIDKGTYAIMKKQYWGVWSWAIRWEPADKPTSNTDDMTRINNPDLLKIINTWYVFVWLNLSSTHWDKWCVDGVTWSNFHSGYSHQQDFKLRYALKDTNYWGSYITDLIKYYPEIDSGKVGSYLKKHPEVVLENVKSFKKEIWYLWDVKLVALGSKTYNLLIKHLGNEYKIYKIKHYACRISKEKYKEEVLSMLW